MKAVGYKKSLPIEDADSLIDFETAKPEPKGRDIRGQLRRLLLAGAAVAALSGAVWYGWDYWTAGRFLVSTDDAYVKADNTGYLTEVLARQRARQGRPSAGTDR